MRRLAVVLLLAIAVCTGGCNGGGDETKTVSGTTAKPGAEATGAAGGAAQPSSKTARPTPN